MIRTPTVADRAAVRTIINQNVALMDEPSLTVARVLDLITHFPTRVHVDDTLGTVDGVITVDTLGAPKFWEMKILFVLAGIGQTRFLTAFLDMQRAVGVAAQNAGVQEIGSQMKMPIVAFVANLLQAQRQAGGWNVRFTNSLGMACSANDPDAKLMHSRGTIAQFLAGIAATTP